jgi:hypothetical protein
MPILARLERPLVAELLFCFELMLSVVMILGINIQSLDLQRRLFFSPYINAESVLIRLSRYFSIVREGRGFLASLLLECNVIARYLFDPVLMNGLRSEKDPSLSKQSFLSTALK